MSANRLTKPNHHTTRHAVGAAAGTRHSHPDFLKNQSSTADDPDHQDEGERVAVGPVQLGHVVEVHAVDAGDQGGHDDERGTGGDLAHVLVLLHRDPREVGVEGGRQQDVEAVDHLRDPLEVVGHVAEVGRGLGRDRDRRADRRHRVGVHRELPHRLAQRHHRAPHLRDLALEDVDPVGVVGAGLGEDRLLDLVDVLLERRADLLVLVDHPVADGVHDAHRAVLEHLGPGLEVAAGVGEVDALRRGGPSRRSPDPTNMLISPVSTASSSSTYQSVLSTRKSVSP